MPKDEKPKGKWSDSRVVVDLGQDLRAQLQALADAARTPLTQLAKQAIEGFVKGQKGLREAAVRQLAEKLGIQVDFKGRQQ